MISKTDGLHSGLRDGSTFAEKMPGLYMHMHMYI